VKGAKKLGVRVGNWLSAEQGKKLLASPSGLELRAVRNRAVLAVLMGCGLRRAEIVAVAVEDFELREDHWVLADLIGKGGHMRTIPVPGWVKATVDAWVRSANLQSGVLFRPVGKTGNVRNTGFTAKVIWSIVRKAAADCDFGAVAPHDLRRTCARLCHQAGGELEQIQFLLGHVSVQTTERYLGCKQRLRNAVNDRIGLEPDPP
jgi:site-specific recombinase XerD